VSTDSEGNSNAILNVVTSGLNVVAVDADTTGSFDVVLSSWRDKSLDVLDDARLERSKVGERWRAERLRERR
jgi:hypothetical protein